MCHDTSAAPPLPAALAEHSRQTTGPDPVPYLSIEPSGTGDGTAIVLITDIFGINPFYRHLAGLLAGQGYRVAIPDVFHRVGPAADGSREAALARRQLLDDDAAAADVKRVIDQVAGAPRSFGVLGFCLGGSLALLTAADYPSQATVTYYAFPRNAPGAKVPTVEPLQVASSIVGPVLAHWGRDDYIDAGDVEQLAAVLDSAPGQSQVRWYENAGHAFLAGLTEPGHPSAKAASESWDLTVSFFAQHVGRAPAALGG
jgi:carboxymethylenebutenolidase